MRLTTVFVLLGVGAFAGCALWGARLAKEAREIRQENMSCLRRLAMAQTTSDSLAILIATPACADVLHILQGRKL